MHMHTQRLHWLVLVCCFLSTPAWSDAQTWKINLKNADIREFITQVSTITGKTFVVDPRVKGNVTVVSDRNLDTDAVYALFLSVLRVHGFGASRTGDVVRIVQSATVKQSGAPVNDDGGSLSEEVVTRVISARNVAAAELVKILRPMIPQYGHIAAVAQANVVIISDHADNIGRLLTIIRQVDVADEDEVVVVALEQAWVGSVVEILEQVAPDQIGKSADGPQRVLVIGNDRNNTLVLRGKSGPIAEVRSLIEQLDQPATSSGSTRVFKLNHADATGIAEILNGVLIDPRGRGDNSKSENTSIQADTSLNAIVVRADPGTITEIEDILRQLDIRKAQVLIEAAIVEISVDETSAIGIEAGAADATGESVPFVSTTLNGIISNVLSNIAATAGESGKIDPVQGIASVGSPTLAVARLDPDGVSFGAILNALAVNTSADLLSTPSVLTLDNEQANILAGQTVPFRTGSFTSTNNGASNPFTTIQRQDVGIELTVTPHIHDDSSIRLEVSQSVENVVNTGLEIGEAGFSDVVTNKRSIETTILADDRQTIVLGGLIQDDLRETRKRVPLIGSIPVLGRLFQNRSKARTKRHLLVFLRPTIQRNREEVADTTDRKYKGIWQVQIESRESGSESEPQLEQIYEGRRD
ncbi:MAG TPA: type II secretion system protein GspD [Gammaproteobacteria bacterium]|nr:type II secretion system protein GspD [Gammaproteobacteria bacterium]HCP50548.1 type II secretion system protein GspD [Gammaproteobacteria bacterium]|tara:strand:+ start:1614 stop:3539 length:1926 start_codon:yes stop_codon:yes gene_type:complete